MKLHEYIPITFPDKPTQWLSEIRACWLKELPFWDETEIHSSLKTKTSSLYYLADGIDSQWQGLCMLQNNISHIDLLFIYLRPLHRKSGWAEKLLQQSLSAFGHPELDVLLEVREPNIAARKFYEKYGFKKTGTRPKYYSNGDNAVLYRLTSS